MTTSPGHPHPAADRSTARIPTSPPSFKVQEALDARDALATALTRAGIQLPAMDIRTPWADAHDREARYALVHLGVCAAPVAHQLADALVRGLDR